MVKEVYAKETECAICHKLKSSGRVHFIKLKNSKVFRPICNSCRRRFKKNRGN